MASKTVAVWHRERPYRHVIGFVTLNEPPPGYTFERPFTVYDSSPHGPFVVRDAHGEGRQFASLDDAMTVARAEIGVCPGDVLEMDATFSVVEAA